jgi:hypothetical protein
MKKQSLNGARNRPTTPGDYVNQFGGDISVYVQILSIQDCTTLQQEYDQLQRSRQAEEQGAPGIRLWVGYLIAVSDRLEKLECDEVV